MKDWGFSDWHLSASQSQLREGWVIARVLEVHRTNWLVATGELEMRAELTGKLAFSVESSEDRPAVGDFVQVQIFDGGDFAIIDDVLPRRTRLQRKTAGVDVGVQIIASNVDTAFIVQSCDRDFNLRRLERYLVTVREGNIEPILLLSKQDLVSREELDVLLASIREVDSDLLVVPFSGLDNQNIDAITQLMTPGKTFCLLGSSGVGKTTLLNRSIGDERHATAAVREDDHRGRHTTTHRHLERFESGAMLIDTPGMREMGLLGSESGLDETFADIAELASSCRFADCAHELETGCAVTAAVESGELDEARVSSWRKLQRESRRHDMSLAEKRRKDKEQGKMYKRIQQEKRQRR